jgi:hypothetical protein
MPNYEYYCGNCDAVTIHASPYSSRPDKVECACGGEGHYTISSPNINGKASFLDGHKRKGWKDMKEIGNLKVAAAGSRPETRKEIVNEIKKLKGKVD